MATVKADDVTALAEALAVHQKVLVLTHNNPDPDAIASAAGMRAIAAKVAGVPAALGYAGFLTRAENKEMVDRLKIPLQHVGDIDMRRYRGVILVDTQPQAGNNALSEKLTPIAVVDHHAVRKSSRSSPFMLVDKQVGATSTLVYEMLKAANARLTGNLATALFLGIKTDTQDLGREATERDLAAYKELFPQARHRVLAQVTHPRRAPEYFRVLHRALETAVVCGDCIYAPIGEVVSPEFISEIADYLVALQGIRWAIVTGRFAENLYFSTRTMTARKDAGRILKRAMGRFGVAGGHQKIAGGLLPLSEMEPARREAAEATVISKLLESVGANMANTRPLLAPPKQEDQTPR